MIKTMPVRSNESYKFFEVSYCYFFECQFDAERSIIHRDGKTYVMRFLPKYVRAFGEALLPNYSRNSGNFEDLDRVTREVNRKASNVIRQGNRPYMVTVCTIYAQNIGTFLGISICSKDEADIILDVGDRLAYSRAIKRFKRKLGGGKLGHTRFLEFSNIFDESNNRFTSENNMTIEEFFADNATSEGDIGGEDDEETQDSEGSYEGAEEEKQFAVS